MFEENSVIVVLSGGGRKGGVGDWAWQRADPHLRGRFTTPSPRVIDRGVSYPSGIRLTPGKPPGNPPGILRATCKIKNRKLSTVWHEAIEATLSDIKADKMISVWLDESVTDRNLASFVLITR